jgi:serine/threonine-protein phosphatase CPPED1
MMIRRIVKEHPVRIILACLCILLLISITFWKSYAPLSIHEWNRREISKIKLTNPDDFTFAVFGDNKGNASFFDPLLRDIGHDKEITFAMDIGDLVADGKRSQYRRFIDQVREKLSIPLLTATGNHDFNNGFDEYSSIFGPTYYAFQAGFCSFVVLDATNDSGFDKTQRQWLEDELRKAQDAKARFVFMHIPPFDPRGGGSYLSERDRDDLQELFTRYRVTHLFTSHIHGYFSGVWGGVPYTITGGAGARLQGSDPKHFFHHYIKVHVNDGKVDTTIRLIDAENIVVRLYDSMENHAFDAGLLLCAGACLLTAWLSMRKRRRIQNG